DLSCARSRREFQPAFEPTKDLVRPLDDAILNAAAPDLSSVRKLAEIPFTDALAHEVEGNFSQLSNRRKIWCGRVENGIVKRARQPRFESRVPGTLLLHLH